MDKKYLQILIWAGIISAGFGVLWFTGNLARLRNYILETREELRKCTWPSWDELRGSTIIVLIAILFLGVFTVVIDYALVMVVSMMAKI